jgi:hypothetical protein
MAEQHMMQMKQQVESELKRERSSGVRQMLRERGESGPSQDQVAVGVSHCGAGWASVVK